MSNRDLVADLYKVCVKLYGPEPREIGDDATAFVPIFHDWIRNRALDLVMIDVADYAHAPDSPGIMLVTHEVAFALDRSDGRFGLLAQRRTPLDGGAGEAITRTLRDTLAVADKLEAEPTLSGKVTFERKGFRIEANDRLRAPNTDAGFEAFAPAALAAVQAVLPGRRLRIERVRNDPRDRLAIDVHLEAADSIAA